MTHEHQPVLLARADRRRQGLTLRRTMKLAVLAALEQRTALRYTMPGMTAAETAS
jgi:hypothetical protein